MRRERDRTVQIQGRRDDLRAAAGDEPDGDRHRGDHVEPDLKGSQHAEKKAGDEQGKPESLRRGGIAVEPTREWCTTLLKSYNFPVPATFGEDFDQSIELVAEQLGLDLEPDGEAALTQLQEAAVRYRITVDLIAPRG